MNLWRAGWRWGALLMVLALLGGVQRANAAWYWPFGHDGLSYKVEFSGEDAEVKAWLEELKLNQQDKSRVITTDEELQQELAVRGGRVQQALAALGYYDAVLVQRVEKNKDSVLVYEIQQGPRYKVGKVTMDWEGAPLKEVSETILRTKVGAAVNAADIMADAVDVLNAVGKRACLLQLDVVPLVKIYDNHRRAEVVFRIKHGAVANFGPTTVSGTERVNPQVVLREVTWQEGKCYRESKVDETRTNLIENQLFSTVAITHPEEVDANGEVPMTIAVKERAERTLRAGASYSTDEGAVVNGGWEHWNFFGNGEKLTNNLSIGQFEQSLDSNLRIPDFWAPKQTLVLRAKAGHEDRNAYRADTAEVGAGLERKLSRHWKGGLGTAFTLAKTEDALVGNSRYALLSFPGFVEYDTRNDVLDPKRGMLANVTVTPYTETFGDGGQFLKTQGSLQTYLTGRSLPLSPTLALKVAGGSIAGASGQDVPADVRFYAGGGGSVRGYGYQTLGPRVGTKAVGGNSFVAGSAEGRLRFGNDWGGVAFMDAGNAYDTETPDVAQKLYTSVGVGARYYTGIGPIRADIAVPLNGSDIGAAGYAVYISIGQSF